MTHSELVQRAAKWLRSRGCGVVLTERASAAVEVPDAIGWKWGQSHVVECKVSRSDFRADLKKPWHQVGLGCYRWFLTPEGLLTATDIPDGYGWLECAAGRTRKRIEAVRRDGRSEQREIHLLVSELRRYQLHGITYPPLTVNKVGGYGSPQEEHP